jgi:pimeloyl-ACP methyl ester carboxylesterase
MALIALDGGRLFAEATPEPRPPVLALHGWQRTHADFAPLLHRTGGLALDLPGFGASPPPPDAWGAREYARAVEPALQSLGAPAVVVGHSFGGRVAVCLAAGNPSLVRALILAAAPLVRLAPARRPSLGYRTIRFLHRMRVIGDRRMEAARYRYGSHDYRAASGIMRGVLVRTVGESYEDELRQLRCPVDLVWGDLDRDVPVAVAERAAALVGAGASVTVLPDTDHLGTVANADILQELVRRRLS